MAAAAVLGLVAAAVIMYPLAIPIDVHVAEPTFVVETAAPVNDANRERQFDPKRLEKLAARDLHPPLPGQEDSTDSDPTPPKATQAVKAEPPPVQLVGILSEPGHSMAMLRRRDGSIAVCAVGETVEQSQGQVQVVEVSLGKVVIRHGNREHTLAMPQEQK